MKTVTFTIEPFTESLNRFKETFKSIQAGRPVKPQEIVGFTSLEAARNFLTRERLALLRTIKSHHPNSIYELAKITGRGLKNVQEDVRILERHGQLRITKQPRGNRKVKVPSVPFEEIALRIAI
ncbi:MAG: ArsR family transcriptional regulator [Deltaproteobacteria bacterium]|nr:ArsR family transcriptional regulator [Deltaproteobacteria bacterium]